MIDEIFGGTFILPDIIDYQIFFRDIRDLRGTSGETDQSRVEGGNILF